MLQAGTGVGSLGGISSDSSLGGGVPRVLPPLWWLPGRDILLSLFILLAFEIDVFPDLRAADCLLSDVDLCPPDRADVGGFSLPGGDGCLISGATC